jgi:hypothetical protein
MNLLLGIIIFAIGFIIVLIAILMIAKNIKNESLIEVDTKAESVTETQTESAANSAIKVALMQNYPEAEIISNENDL